MAHRKKQTGFVGEAYADAKRRDFLGGIFKVGEGQYQIHPGKPNGGWAEPMQSGRVYGKDDFRKIAPLNLGYAKVPCLMLIADDA